jgi:hypothetical protein
MREMHLCTTTVQQPGKSLVVKTYALMKRHCIVGKYHHAMHCLQHLIKNPLLPLFQLLIPIYTSFYDFTML